MKNSKPTIVCPLTGLACDEDCSRDEKTNCVIYQASHAKEVDADTLVELVKKARHAALEMINFMDDHMMNLADEQKDEYDALYAAFDEATAELDSYIGL